MCLSVSVCVWNGGKYECECESLCVCGMSVCGMSV